MLIMFSAFGSKRSKHHHLCFGYISHLLMKSLWPFAKISILYSISKFFSMVALRTESQKAHQGSASEFRSYPNAKLLRCMEDNKLVIIELAASPLTCYGLEVAILKFLL